jgi:transcriptional regulator with PAS, ATPase and Fis domain
MHGDNRGIIGSSSVVQRLRPEIERAARSDAKVLVTGESGVGKDVVAHLIHRGSRRSGGRFVAINCAALPDSLLESELFGHVRGSFTGAFRDKVGLLEAANGGTIFMDEIGETSLRMQALLLRFLENGEILRVGAERPQSRSDVRVVTATNRDLAQMVADGQFRNDLYYRLNVLHVHVPPLRERREDVPAFLEHFLEEYAVKHRTAPVQLTPDALATLTEYDWRGNVRELKNIVERIVVGSGGGPVDVGDLPPAVLRGARPAPRPTTPGEEAPTPVRPIVNQLLNRMVLDRESFWTTVYPMFVARDLTRDELRMIVTHGLVETRGSYRAMLQLFNMAETDYKRFLNVLRKHQCHMPPIRFRTVSTRRALGAAS